MYSVVMMMAMTGAPEMPAGLFRKNGCDGGCHGAAACYGNGCRGYDDCGCHGRRERRGHGCRGYDNCGCCGYSSCGCGGYTAGCGCGGHMANCGCCGQMANCGCCGQMAACGCCGQMAAPPAGTPAPPAMPPKDGKKEAMIAAPATIIVSLPAEATLKIDGVVTKQTAAVRQFATPTLVAGQNFFYTLTAEVVRDGQTLTSVQKVTVRAGELTNVALPIEQFGQTVVMK